MSGVTENELMRSHAPTGRPTTSEWLDALDDLIDALGEIKREIAELRDSVGLVLEYVGPIEPEDDAA